MPRILALLPSNTYRAHDLLIAARRLEIELIVATEQRQALEGQTDDTTVTFPFDGSLSTVQRVLALHDRRRLDAVVGLDDETTWCAAILAEALGLPGNPPQAVAATRSKLTMRRQLAAAGMRGPAFAAVAFADLDGQAAKQQYPCVLKPTFLSASRGVIRADDAHQFRLAAQRIATLLDDPELQARGGDEAGLVLVESYLPGDEVAVEALLGEEGLQLLAIFDKPQPLTGPFFEETIYVTPSRHPAEVLAAIETEVWRATQALGLVRGPIHAECRLYRGIPTLLELAPRPIGGLCPRVVPLAFGIRLEELILRAALGWRAPTMTRDRAAGVMMIPVPNAGTLRSVHGLDRARAEHHIHDVEISILVGQPVVPLPEGNRYLGFIFAAASTPAAVQEALTLAHSHLRFEIN